jgi:hypothetical protein
VRSSLSRATGVLVLAGAAMMLCRAPSSTPLTMRKVLTTAARAANKDTEEYNARDDSRRKGLITSV